MTSSLRQLREYFGATRRARSQLRKQLKSWAEFLRIIQRGGRDLDRAGPVSEETTDGERLVGLVTETDLLRATYDPLHRASRRS